jgi:transcriptional regulator with XRE-family HTH domain
MDIMDTARLNIKRRREMKGLRQQDLAEKLNMNIRTYQNLEGGVTRLDIERLEQIAKVLDMPVEDLLKQEGYYFHQEIKDSGLNNGSGVHSGFGNENTYNYGTEKEILEKLLDARNEENQVLKEEVKSLKEETKYLREKIDQLMEVVGKKG